MKLKQGDGSCVRILPTKIIRQLVDMEEIRGYIKTVPMSQNNFLTLLGTNTVI